MPYSLAMNDSGNHTAYLNAGYGASMGSLNPVLANLLAPLGVSTSSGQGSMARPSPGVGGVGGSSHSGLPPVFPLFASPSAGMRNAGVVLPNATSSSAPPASGAQGILGDGDVAWREAVLPAVFPQYPTASSQQK